MDLWREFHGPNAGIVLELFERYRRDPASVDEATRAFFAGWRPPAESKPGLPAPPCETIVGAVNLAQSIRAYGHLAARLDPLGAAPRGDPSLLPETYGITEDDLGRLPASLIGGPVALQARSAREAVQALRAIYSSTTGYGYGHIHDPEERDWLRHAAESGRFRAPQDPINRQALLRRLTQVEAFEHFLHRVFPGKTRFSLEGLDMLVPMLDEVIGEAAESGTRKILIGMAHRGRLNVLAHVLNRPYAQILAEFKDPTRGRNFTIREDLSWTGDVRYHLGAHRAVEDGTPVDVVVSMPPNPSHLEYINPVVEGMARAAGTRTDESGPPVFDPHISLPILVHGDAAFPGQGVVAETLNLSRLPGYHTGGTIHIIANNQLGYTTEPQDARSTLYASDLAKGFEVPIVHVNADDPEACIEAARLAFAYRAEFHKDFLIDLVGYRRYGHNEGDEPSFTQPQMFEKIEGHPTVRQLWADALLQRSLIDPARPKMLVDEHMEALQRVLDSLHPERDLAEPFPAPPPPGAARRVQTAVPAARLRELHAALHQVPGDFTVNPKLERAIRRHLRALDDPNEPSIEWATAEELALASILVDGIAIRLTGEDVERGTFGQRHAVFHDVKTGKTFTPLQATSQAKAAFEIHNSPLTEGAAVGYEYGYDVQEPGRLVIWEAQYGDFINAAQVMIDEFIVSARAKWGQTPSLVLLLPHGYEGQGPDHSSARLERFLGLAAETNMRIANCTTAAQYFHLLRRQAALLETDPLPLVVMTPKSLLRHPRTHSSLRELAEGQWQAVIDDREARHQAGQVRRLILCSGKVYLDLVTNPIREETPVIAITRIEQLHPFPAEDLRPLLEGYPELGEVVWLQEEPENMGAWRYMQPRLGKLINGRWPLRYIGRPPNSSPAEGSSAWHTVNQKALVERAYNLESHVLEDIVISSEWT
ncbi:MAG TPA: 2-oxoglutarate dehydrogenase E1 component [Candidatus Methylomirabilis sp.]|nr:2-oxoglutarate dehydrogenase E1 component [Candidatus Methylomirabilis sp.]